MPEVFRVIAARLRHYVADRRSARRFPIQLPCTVGLSTGVPGVDRVRGDASLEGTTCDISETGLGLLMPAIHIAGHYLTGAGTTLLILLELPEAPILLKCVAMRYERLEQEGVQMKYLIGVRITEMNDLDRARLLAILK